MKSILLISHSTNKTGGGEDDFQSLLEYFKSKDYIIYSVFPDGYRAEYFKSLSDYYLVLPNNIFPFVGFNFRKYIFFIHFAFKKIVLLLPFLNLVKKKIDICFINSSVCIPEIISINIVGIPYILSIKEIINPVLIRKLIYNYINRSAKAVIVISDFLKKIVSEHINTDKLYIIRSSLNEKLCKLIKENVIPKNNNEFVISNLGVITPVKNQLLLLESLKEVKSHKLIVVNIIGRIEDISYYHKLKKISEEISSANIKINFAGEVSRNIALEYIAKSDLIVNTSLFEGMSLVIAEALFFQIPIITTNTGVASEVIENKVNGFIINYDDSAMLSYLINKLSKDEEILNYISINQSATYSQYFDSNYYYSEHENIIKKWLTCQ